jgi:hypothetical protein
VDTRHNWIGHEPDSTDIRAVSLTGLALALGVATILLMIYGGFQYLVHHRVIVTPSNPLAETDPQQFPPRPRIDEHPSIELMELRLHEDQVLSTYGWVDRKTGVVRIPIDQAIALQLKRGFAARKERVPK